MEILCLKTVTERNVTALLALFQPLKSISEINGKADNSIAALNGHCEDEDELAAEGGYL